MTAASPGIADAYTQSYGVCRPAVVLNVFPRENAPKGPTAAGIISPGPSLYWFSQTIGANRGLEVAIEAISLSVARPHLYLRGTLAAGYGDVLGSIANQFGVTARIHVLEPAAPSEMERLASAYDVGLAGEIGETPNSKIALANKLFSYLLAGIPAIASSIPAHRRLDDVEGAVFHYEPLDAAGLGCALDMLLLDPKRLKEARNRAWRLGQQRYNWDIEKHVLISVVKDLKTAGNLTRSEALA
jgi:glycosyltransferase involved in cell wall biosynthesis